MHDAPGVRRGETPGDLLRPVHGLRLRDRPAVELPAQRLALEQLGDRVRDAVLRAEVVDREDVRVRQRGDRLSLALEARERVRIRRQVRRKDLDRDVASSRVARGRPRPSRRCPEARRSDLTRDAFRL
jgi:hypothetical protein